ncbi:rod shape-determining protein RodA, partial [Pseudomonas syringae pv. tagetis]
MKSLFTGTMLAGLLLSASIMVNAADLQRT